ncbi:Uncharacterised protein [Mycobacterium tuberculosis]|nr:Uncharacterised protein [Mycobacterium tuberculosis]
MWKPRWRWCSTASERRTTASPDACRNVSRCRSPSLRLAGSGSPWHRMRSRSTAAMATSRPGRWPGCCVTRKSTRSGRAPTTSCVWMCGAGSSRRALTRHCWRGCAMRCRCPTMTTPRGWSRAALRTSTRRSPLGPNSTGSWPRRGCSRWPNSWATSTPARCSPSRPPGNGQPAAPTARHSSPACTRAGISRPRPAARYRRRLR